MIGFGLIDYVVLIVYLACMMLVGLLLSGRQKTTEDYFLAGRQMPWLIVGMSMFASLTSASTYMGVPGIAYSENISIIFGIMVSPIVAPILILIFYPFYRRLHVTTSYEYILARFGTTARFVVSGLFVLARLGWLGVVIYAPALALSVVTAMPLWLAICLMGLLATAYTTLGGLSAVLWTDMVQFVILVIGAIWLSISLCSNVPGGFEEIIRFAGEAGKLDVFDWRIDFYKMTALAAAITWFFMFMQDYGTDQVTVQRLMAIKDFRGTAKAIIFNSVSDVIINTMLLFIGLGLFVYFGTYPDTLGIELSPDQMLPFYIVKVLPTGISGLIITAIFAAAMSSMDSGINSIATVITNDFIKPLEKTCKTEKYYVQLARILTIILGIVATLIAFYASTIGNIIKVWSTVLGLFAGPILAIFLLGIMTRRTSFTGWLVGMLIAIVVTAWVQNFTTVHWVYYFPLCFTISFVGGYTASILIKAQLTDSKYTLWDRSSGQ